MTETRRSSVSSGCGVAKLCAGASHGRLTGVVGGEAAGAGWLVVGAAALGHARDRDDLAVGQRGGAGVPAEGRPQMGGVRRGVQRRVQWQRMRRAGQVMPTRARSTLQLSSPAAGGQRLGDRHLAAVVVVLAQPLDVARVPAEDDDACRRARSSRSGSEGGQRARSKAEQRRRAAVACGQAAGAVNQRGSAVGDTGAPLSAVVTCPAQKAFLQLEMPHLPRIALQLGAAGLNLHTAVP